MLYVLKAIDYGEVYECEYGNLRHAMEHYDKEKNRYGFRIQQWSGKNSRK